MLTNFVEVAADRSMRPGSEIELINLSRSSNPSATEQEFDQARDAVRRALGKLVVRVDYRDIYRRKQKAAERKLDWFNRHFVSEGG